MDSIMERNDFDLLDLTQHPNSVLEINIQKTNELNQIFTALDNTSPLVEQKLVEDEEIDEDYENIFNNNTHRGETKTVMEADTPVQKEQPTIIEKKHKRKKERDVSQREITNEMLDEIFLKTMAKTNNSGNADDGYEWIGNKAKFKKNDEFSRICKYIDESILMEACIHFNIHTDNYVIDMDKLITKFERLNKTKINETFKYYIIYKDPYAYPFKRIDSYHELSWSMGKFAKTTVDGTYDANVLHCKKYLAEHEKYKKSDSCGFKREFELKGGKMIELFVVVKRG